MQTKILLCTDMDRTILPNGELPESEGARDRFRKIVSSDHIILSYVTGRNKSLISEAINAYALPVPDFAIGDVGTSIYRIKGAEWQKVLEWDNLIGVDWKGGGREAILGRLSEEAELSLQEEAQQGKHKISFYCEQDKLSEDYIDTLRSRLAAEGTYCTFIWSIDELKQIGLIDILPRKADKYHAVRFLMDQLNFPETRVLYAGDSGNDLPVLVSSLRSVIVKNARREIKDLALQAVKAEQREDTLYLARGDLAGLNGNYTAGVIEGLLHFFPELK